MVKKRDGKIIINKRIGDEKIQTFLPYPSFKESAKCLDRQRLGKQRVEAYQILKILLGEGKKNKNGKTAWENHPAVKMWKGYEFALFVYTVKICDEWVRRWYKDTIIPKSVELISKRYANIDILMRNGWYNIPFHIIGNEKFHASHRSNLLRKNKEWYSQFNWSEPDDLPYVWPI